MAFSMKEWKDRVVEHAWRFLATNVETEETTNIDARRNEGKITEEGTALSAENMNDLEQRIYDAIQDAEDKLSELNTQIAEAESQIADLDTAISNKANASQLTDGSVTKVGTATVGGTARGIYLNGGTPTALSASVGSADQPVYLNSGALTVCSNFETSMASCTLASGISTSNKTLQVIRYGNMVMIQGSISFTYSQGLLLATIPSGYRPTWVPHFWATGSAINSDDILYRCYLTTSGALYLEWGKDMNTSTTVTSGSVSWFDIMFTYPLL